MGQKAGVWFRDWAREGQNAGVRFCFVKNSGWQAQICSAELLAMFTAPAPKSILLYPSLQLGAVRHVAGMCLSTMCKTPGFRLLCLLCRAVGRSPTFAVAPVLEIAFQRAMLANGFDLLRSDYGCGQVANLAFVSLFRCRAGARCRSSQYTGVADATNVYRLSVAYGPPARIY